MKRLRNFVDARMSALLRLANLLTGIQSEHWRVSCRGGAVADP
jgi:hypothetical protein